MSYGPKGIPVKTPRKPKETHGPYSLASPPADYVRPTVPTPTRSNEMSEKTQIDLTQFKGHTEGPWSREYDELDGTSSSWLQDEKREYIGVAVKRNTMEEMEANIKIMIASPSLLALAREQQTTIDALQALARKLEAGLYQATVALESCRTGFMDINQIPETTKVLWPILAEYNPNKENLND